MGRPKTPRLPGFDDPQLQALEDAARDYVESRDARINLTARETETHDFLLELMKKQGRTAYQRGDLLITIASKEKVKVKINSDVDIDEATVSVSPGGPKHVALPPDSDDKPAAQPVETPEEKEAFDGDPRASAAAEKSNHYPAVAKKRSERGKHLRPVTSSKSGKSAPAAS